MEARELRAEGREFHIQYKAEYEELYNVYCILHPLTCDAEEDPDAGEVEVDGDAIVCVLVEYSGCLLQQLNSLLYCCWMYKISFNNSIQSNY